MVDYTLPVDVSYQADVFGSIRRSVAASTATAQASTAELENARLTYQAQLAQLYFQLHGPDGEADLLQRTVTAYQDCPISVGVTVPSAFQSISVFGMPEMKAIPTYDA